MTGLSDTERDNLAGFLRWVRDSSAWSSPSDITEPSAELCEHVDALIAAREQAATLAERERLLGVIEYALSAQSLVARVPTHILRDLIAQERAR